MKALHFSLSALGLIIAAIVTPLVAQPLQPVDISVTPPPPFFATIPEKYAIQSADTIGSTMLIVWGNTRAISDTQVVGELWYQFADEDGLMGTPNRLTSLDGRPYSSLQIFHTRDVFVVTWLDEREMGKGGGRYLQRFNTGGFPIGDRINLSGTVNAGRALNTPITVIGDPDRGRLLMWQQDSGVWGVHLDSAGGVELPAEYITPSILRIEPIFRSDLTGIVRKDGQMMLVGNDGQLTHYPLTLPLSKPDYIDGQLDYARIANGRLEIYESIFDSVPAQVIALPMLDSSFHKQGVLTRDSSGRMEVNFLTSRLTGSPCYNPGKITNTIYRINQEALLKAEAPKVLRVYESVNAPQEHYYTYYSRPKPELVYGLYNTSGLNVLYTADQYKECYLYRYGSTSYNHTFDSLGRVGQSYRGTGGVIPYPPVDVLSARRLSESVSSTITVNSKPTLSIRIHHASFRTSVPVSQPALVRGYDGPYLLFNYPPDYPDLPIGYGRLGQNETDSSILLQRLPFGPVSTDFVYSQYDPIEVYSKQVVGVYSAREISEISGTPVVATTEYQVVEAAYYAHDGPELRYAPNCAFHIYRQDSSHILRAIYESRTILSSENFYYKRYRVGHFFGTLPRRNEIVFGMFWGDVYGGGSQYGSSLDSIIAIRPDGSFAWKIRGYFAPDATYLPIDSARYMVVRADSTLIMFGTSVDRVIHYPKATRGFRAFSREDGALLRTYADASDQALLHVELYAPNGDVIVARQFVAPDSALTKGNYSLVQRDSDHSFTFLWGTQNDGIHGMMLDHTLSIVVRDTLISNWRGKAINPSGVMQGDTLRVVWEDYRGTMSDIYTNSMVMPQTSTLSVEGSDEGKYREEIGAIIHPNPATEYLQIDLRQFPDEGSIRLELYDARGAVVKTMEAEPGSRPTISTGALPAGFYRVTWEQGVRRGSISCTIIR